MDCHGLPKKLQALQPTLVFVLLSHHNGLQYQVEPFFRQTSLIYAHLAPETDFELATLPRGPPIFRFGFQKKNPGLLKDGGITCAQRAGKNSRLSPSATKCASVYISLNFHEPQPVRLTVTVTPAKPKSFSGKDHLARVLSLVSRATAGPGSKLVIRWMLWVSTEELVKHFAAMSSSFSSLRPRNLGQGREPYVSVSSASVSSWNFNCWKPPTGSLEEPVKNRSNLFKAFLEGGRPLFFLLRSWRVSNSTCFWASVHFPSNSMASDIRGTLISESPSTKCFKALLSACFQNVGSEMTWRKPFTIAAKGACRGWACPWANLFRPTCITDHVNISCMP